LPSRNGRTRSFCGAGSSRNHARHMRVHRQHLVIYAVDWRDQMTFDAHPRSHGAARQPGSWFAQLPESYPAQRTRRRSQRRRAQTSSLQ
jgi:hypothetical protein